MGENIGAAARVAKNFAISDLRIVAPRDGWPNPKAHEMAAGAKDLIENAKLFDSTAEAIADLHKIYATTARDRYMEKQVFTAREAGDDAKKQLESGQTIGLLFGPERSGLENEDIALANAMVTIPVNPDYGSLNLAQAVGIVCYECSQVVPEASTEQPEIATKQEIHGLFDHLEQELDQRNFWKVDTKKPAMWRNIRNLFQRTDMTSQEVRTLRGIIRCLTDFR